MTDRPYFGLEAPIRFAHRGSRLLWPENTWYAFDAAVQDFGYRYIETDIRITRDGVVVVFHDETLERTTNGTGKVSEWEWEDLRHLDAGYQFSTDGEEFPMRGSGIAVSRLDDTLERYPDVCFNIDLKEPGSEWPVAEVVAKMRCLDSVLIGSFSDRRISRFRRITKGGVATSAGPSEAMAMFAASRLGRTSRRRADAYQLPRSIRGASVDRKLVDAVHAAGAQIHVWTIDEPKEMHELLDLGVDGIISDRPDLLNDVIEGRHDDER
ncbi:MAG: glycerophosphodiester phosphodiesterase [Actinomycetia bacterium]|nr:glycerophosphodiester phosphodiesterase [Actinomycetes bacterium]